MKKHVLMDLAQVGFCLSNLKAATLEFEGLSNELEVELQALRDEYAPKLTEATLNMETEERLLREWLSSNKKDFEGPPRSMEFADGIIGFRLGQPRLTTVNKKFTWAKVLETLQAAKRKMFIREKYEVDREALLKAVTEKTLGEDTLHEFGLKKVQDDDAFVDIKREMV